MFIVTERLILLNMEYKESDIIYEAIANLEAYTGLQINVETARPEYDAILEIKGQTFYVEAKSNARKSNIGIILSHLKNQSPDKKWLLIADYIAKEVAQILKQENWNYLDTAGNASIQTDNLFIVIEGKKKLSQDRKNQSRAFQEAGLKLLLLLISGPQSLQLSYRELSEKTNVSLGSVSNIIKELEENAFILKTQNTRILKNTDILIERWVTAYNEVLKPRLFRKRYRAANDSFNWMEEVQEGLGIYWGGEPGASLLTGQLRPVTYTLYYNGELPRLAQELKLIPDNNGTIEVYNTFWLTYVMSLHDITAPPLVIYADLMGTDSSRNAEIAKLILENGL